MNKNLQRLGSSFRDTFSSLPIFISTLLAFFDAGKHANKLISKKQLKKLEINQANRSIEGWYMSCFLKANDLPSFPNKWTHGLLINRFGNSLVWKRSKADETMVDIDKEHLNILETKAVQGQDRLHIKPVFTIIVCKAMSGKEVTFAIPNSFVDLFIERIKNPN